MQNFDTNTLTAIGCGVSVVIELVLIIWGINTIKRLHNNDGNNDKGKE